MKVVISLVLLVFVFFPSHPHASENLSKPRGLFEGFAPTKTGIHLFEFNEDGNHHMFAISMVKLFTVGKRYKFTDDDITCTSNNCSFSLVTSSDIENHVFTLSPFQADSYNVTETFRAKAEGEVHSTIYSIVAKKKQSIVREFFANNDKLLREFDFENDSSIQGVYIGNISQPGSNDNLALLEIYADKPSKLTRYFFGMSITNDVTFDFNSLLLSNDTYNGTVIGKFDEGEITLIKRTNNLIDGYLLERVKSKIMRIGQFRVYRAKPVSQDQDP